MLADAGTVAALHRRENADQGKQARCQVRHWNTGLDGPAAGFAGHRHDARHALRDQIEAPFESMRPGLAVARDRRVDEARIERRQLLIVDAECRHDTGPIVLD